MWSLGNMQRPTHFKFDIQACKLTLNVITANVLDRFTGSTSWHIEHFEILSPQAYETSDSHQICLVTLKVISKYNPPWFTDYGASHIGQRVRSNIYYVWLRRILNQRTGRYQFILVIDILPGIIASSKARDQTKFQDI